MLNQTPTSRFEETSTSALAVAILFFCENTKEQTKNIHLTNVFKKTQIRAENKEILFSSRNKCLTKRLFSLCKESFPLNRKEATKVITGNIIKKIPDKDDRRFLLRFLLKNIEVTHPRPWRLGAHYDRIIDANGKAFCYLSEPEYGLGFPDLENLILVGQKVSEPKPAQSGQMIY